jgi:dipicolinate synthase subunit A
VDLRGRTIAIVGGDDREQEIARLAAATTATVRAHGFPWPDGGIDGVERVDTPEQALDGADYALFPIPGLAEDGTLFAPSAPAPILPDTSLLAHLAENAAIILGTPDARLQQAADELGITLVPYESDQELMLLRGPAIVEGALQRAIEATEVTIHASTSVVIGQGNIGKLLTRTLVLLGAHTHVIARNAVQRAEAYAAGATPHDFDALPGLAADLDALYSTVPVRVVDRPILSRMRPRALVMDLAAPPGGVDLDAAADLGLRAVWARGLGRRAPVTVGRSQWGGIVHRIAELEKDRAR